MLMQIPALSIVMRSGAMADVEYLGINKSGKIAMLKASDWVESKHPRADNGQFGSGSGSSQGRESQGAKHKRNQQARRAEQAAQTTLGGNKAIQSLLSGGSALDKIGWLNTSKPKPNDKKPDAETQPEPPSPEELAHLMGIEPGTMLYDGLMRDLVKLTPQERRDHASKLHPETPKEKEERLAAARAEDARIDAENLRLLRAKPKPAPTIANPKYYSPDLEDSAGGYLPKRR